MKKYSGNQFNKLSYIFFSFVASIVFSLSSYAASRDAQTDPVALLQQIATNMIHQLKTQQATLKTKPDLVYQIANQYVVPFADIPEMSKRVLPPQIWENASESQRKKFEAEFTKLLIRTYASALASYQDQVVQFYPVRGGLEGLSQVNVDSQISSSASSQNIRVTYRLLRTGKVWKLYDMSVEGVDMLESFRAQFADILAQGDMQQLLQRLSSHNDR